MPHPGDERQDHEGQHDVDHADVNGERAGKQRQPRMGDAEREEEVVQYPLALEDDHPAEGADDRAGPQRDQDENHEKLETAPVGASDRIGERVGDDEAEDSHHSGGLDRVRERPGKGGLAEDPAVIGESGMRLEEAAQDDPDQRPEKENGKKEARRQQQHRIASIERPGPASGPRRGRLRHDRPGLRR